MREARHHRACVIECALSERLLQFAQLLIKRVDRVAHPQAEIECDLIIARARRVQPAGIGPNNVSEARFHIHMDVFERARKGEGARLDFVSDLL